MEARGEDVKEQGIAARVQGADIRGAGVLGYKGVGEKGPVRKYGVM